VEANVFDKAVQLVTRHSRSNEATKTIKQSKLFYHRQTVINQLLSGTAVDGKASIIKADQDDFWRMLTEGFFVPYQQAAMIIDDHMILALGDPSPKSQGPTVKRSMVLAFWDEGTFYTLTGVLTKIGYSADRTDFSIEVDLRELFGGIIGGKQILIHDRTELKRSLIGQSGFEKEIMMNIVGGLQATAITNLPSHFIVEETREWISRPSGIVLPHEKTPRYTILTPGQILTRMKKDARETLERKGKKIEFRRAHERLLSDDRWVNLQGQWVHVRAVWNYEAEWSEADESGRNKYRIVLDR